MTSLIDQVPTALLNDWQAKALYVSRSAWVAPLAAPFAIARAQPVNLAELAPWTARHVQDKYTRELGSVPPLRRLPADQRWLETHDDPYLPAGLYEAQVRALYRRAGWALASWYWLGLRNRAYSVAQRFQFHHVPRQTDYRVFGSGSVQPFEAGDWLCIAMVNGEARAFEYSRTWDYSAAGAAHRDGAIERGLAWLATLPGVRRALAARVGQLRLGWKLRPLARAAVGLEPWPEPGVPTAIGQLQVASWRPLQSREV